MYPDLGGYVACRLRPSLTAAPVWRQQAVVVVDAFEAAGHLRPVAPGRYVYTRAAALADPDRTRAAAAANFWAFGAVCHRSDAQFPERYRCKALGKATAEQRTTIRRSLHHLATGRAA
jgi:hypothetical protein